VGRGESRTGTGGEPARKELFARGVEALAGHGEFCNHEVRWLVRTVEVREVLDNTFSGTSLGIHEPAPWVVRPGCAAT
jgi:hypothetical protein